MSHMSTVDGQRERAVKNLVALLLRLKDERRVTFGEIAKSARVTDRTVRNIVQGKRTPKRDTYRRLSEFVRAHGYFPIPVEDAYDARVIGAAA